MLQNLKRLWFALLVFLRLGPSLSERAKMLSDACLKAAQDAEADGLFKEVFNKEIVGVVDPKKAAAARKRASDKKRNRKRKMERKSRSENRKA